MSNNNNKKRHYSEISSTGNDHDIPNSTKRKKIDTNITNKSQSEIEDNNSLAPKCFLCDHRMHFKNVNECYDLNDRSVACDYCKKEDISDKVWHCLNTECAFDLCKHCGYLIPRGRKNEIEQIVTSESESDDPFDDAFNELFYNLKETKLIRKLDVNDDIIEVIAEFGFGQIHECWRCDKEVHIDGIDSLDVELEENDDWVDEQCRECFEKYVCTICQERSEEDNYKCDDCGNMVCQDCDSDNYGWFTKHCEEHQSMDIAPPDNFIENLHMAHEEYNAMYNY
eukprot:256412_1